MNKLDYLANCRIPNERAHGVQILKSCEAFATLGLQVTLLAPTRQQTDLGKTLIPIDKAFGIKSSFKIKQVKTFDPFVLPKIKLVFLWQSWLFSIKCLLYEIKNKSDFIYTRDVFILPFIIWLPKRKCVIELHEPYTNWPKWLLKAFLSRCNAIIATTLATKNRFVACGIDPSKIKVAPNGVDEIFFQTIDKNVVINKYGLPKNKKLVVYAGGLYMWKGIYTLVESTKYLSDDFGLIIAGGTTKDQTLLNEFINQHNLSKKIWILGYHSYLQVPKILQMADVLVVPNTNDSYSHSYTAPIKLMEYLATGKPVVTSDLPAFKELVSEKEVFFFTPENAVSLAKTINLAINYHNQNMKNTEIRLAKKYTWVKRAKQIYKFINNHD